MGAEKERAASLIVLDWLGGRLGHFGHSFRSSAEGFWIEGSQGRSSAFAALRSKSWRLSLSQATDRAVPELSLPVCLCVRACVFLPSSLFLALSFFSSFFPLA